MKIDGRTKHGDSTANNGKPALLYIAWKSMKARCYRPKEARYNRYGGRGIRVCKPWRNDYLTFKLWALGNGFKNGLTLDRLKTNLDYGPDNCQWVTMEINTAKRNVPDRKLSFVQAEEIRASNLTDMELSRKYGINRGGVWRIRNGRSYKKEYAGLV
ncbi:hypothetical protein DRH27_03755 [Candidatus Falkowbacteria bacterium]|nr:MAG: hypothetical protein DRH27_03755 [Candidatus Falkowbacteria bacterium]